MTDKREQIAGRLHRLGNDNGEAEEAAQRAEAKRLMDLLTIGELRLMEGLHHAQRTRTERPPESPAASLHAGETWLGEIDALPLQSHDQASGSAPRPRQILVIELVNGRTLAGLADTDLRLAVRPRPGKQEDPPEGAA